MKRSTLNLTIDLISLMGVLVLVATGLLTRFILPPGSRGGAGLSLWGWTRHDWGDLHFYVALGIASLLVLHLALHWSWAWAVSRNILLRRPNATGITPWKRNAIGAGGLLLLVAVIASFLALAEANVQSVGAGQQRRGPARFESTHEGDQDESSVATDSDRPRRLRRGWSPQVPEAPSPAGDSGGP